MRDILFRGKRTDNGEWVYEDLWCNPYSRRIGWVVSPMNDQGTTGGNEVDPETVGQFIGLYDKNGEKIFEGDIIKCKVHEINGYRVRRGVVEYHGVGFIMNAGFIMNLEPNSWYDQKNISFDCEVIGNIYDNPELLKGGSNEYR